VRPVIALLTDFGTQDHYAGTMKGVILGICPEATLVDITHDIPAHDMLTATLELAASYKYFPTGTIFLVVVDPGVPVRDERAETDEEAASAAVEDRPVKGAADEHAGQPAPQLFRQEWIAERGGQEREPLLAVCGKRVARQRAGLARAQPAQNRGHEIAARGAPRALERGPHHLGVGVGEERLELELERMVGGDAPQRPRDGAPQRGIAVAHLADQPDEAVGGGAGLLLVPVPDQVGDRDLDQIGIVGVEPRRHPREVSAGIGLAEEVEGQRAHAPVGIVQQGLDRARVLPVRDRVHGLERPRANPRVGMPEEFHHLLADRARRNDPQDVERVVHLLGRGRRLLRQGRVAPSGGPREDHEQAQALVAGEAVLGAGRDEDRFPLLDRDPLVLDGEHPASFEHDVDLVVLVGRLVVRLGRDEHVDADLEPGRAVNDLVAARRGLEALLDSRHVEERHGGEPIPRTR